MSTTYLRDSALQTGALNGTLKRGKIKSMDWNVTEITTATYNVTNQDYILVVNNPSLFTVGSGTITVDFSSMIPREGQTIIITDNTGLIGLRNMANLAPYQILAQLGNANKPFLTNNYWMLLPNQNSQTFQYTNGAWSVINPTDSLIFRMGIDSLDRLAPFDVGAFYLIDRDITLNFLGTWVINKTFVVGPNISFNLISSQTNSTSSSDIGGGIIWDPSAGSNVMVEMAGGNNNFALRNLYVRNASTLGGTPTLFSYAAPTPQGTFTIDNVTLDSWKNHGQLERAESVNVSDISVVDADSSGMKFNGCQNVTVRNAKISYSTLTDEGFFSVQNEFNTPNQVASFNNISLTAVGVSDTKKILDVFGGVGGNPATQGVTGIINVSQCTNGGDDIFANTTDRINQTDARINVEQSHPNNSYPRADLKIGSVADQVPTTLNIEELVSFSASDNTTSQFVHWDATAKEFEIQRPHRANIVFYFSITRTDGSGTEAISIQRFFDPDDGGGFDAVDDPLVRRMGSLNDADIDTLFVLAKDFTANQKIRIGMKSILVDGTPDIGLRFSNLTQYNNLSSARVEWTVLSA